MYPLLVGRQHCCTPYWWVDNIAVPLAALTFSYLYWQVPHYNHPRLGQHSSPQNVLPKNGATQGPIKWFLPNNHHQGQHRAPQNVFTKQSDISGPFKMFLPSNRTTQGPTKCFYFSNGATQGNIKCFHTAMGQHKMFSPYN